MFLAVFTLILSDDKNRFFQSTVENSLNDWERLQRNNGGMVSIGACVEKRLGKKNRSTDKLLPSHQNLTENFSKEDSKILAICSIRCTSCVVINRTYFYESSKCTCCDLRPFWGKIVHFFRMNKSWFKVFSYFHHFL